MFEIHQEFVFWSKWPTLLLQCVWPSSHLFRVPNCGVCDFIEIKSDAENKVLVVRMTNCTILHRNFFYINLLNGFLQTLIDQSNHVAFDFLLGCCQFFFQCRFIHVDILDFTSQCGDSHLKWQRNDIFNIICCSSEIAKKQHF